MAQTQNPLSTNLLDFEDLDFIPEIQKLKWDADQIQNRGIFWSDIASFISSAQTAISRRIKLIFGC